VAIAIEPSVLRPRLSGPAAVALPSRADRPFEVASRGARIAVTPVGAADVEGRVEDGVVVYDRAIDGHALLQVPIASGTEEYVHFETRPKESVLRYEVGLDGVVGLRLVGATLEFLVEGGIPALRTSAPVAIDARGAVRIGGLDVEGCAIDRDGRLPFDRPVTSPGAARCTVVVRWSDEGLEYPVLVDPAWTATTGTMALPYYDIVAAPFKARSGSCATGCVLIPGGVVSYSAIGSPASSPESQVYDERTKTFTTVKTPAFRGFGAVGLGDRVMVFGLQGTQQVAIFDPTLAEPWIPIPPPAYNVLGDTKIAVEVAGDVYVDGRYSNPPTSDQTILRYAGATWGTAQPPSALDGQAISSQAGYFFAARREARNVLVVAGGFVKPASTSGAYSTFAGRWTEGTPSGTYASIGTLSAARGYGTSARAANGNWFFLGGQTSPTTVSDAVEIWDGTSLRSAKLVSARSRPVATAFGPDGVLVLGGRNAASAWLKTAEHVRANGTIASTTTMAFAHAAAVTLQSGEVLALGCPGNGAPCGGTQAEIVGLLGAGTTCAAAADCASGFCVDGVCCDRACNAQCEACDAPATKGTCTPVAGAPHGARPACDPAGGDPCKARACDAKEPATCAAFAGGAATTCAPSRCDGSAAISASTCDGRGGCAAPAPRACSP
jgi:hypothetical protein